MAPVEPRVLGEQVRRPLPHRLVGVDTSASHASIHQEDRQPHSLDQREAQVPRHSSRENEDGLENSGWEDGHHSSTLIHDDDHPPRSPSQAANHSSHPPTSNNENHVENPAGNDDILAVIDFRLSAFDDEERIKQAQHEEEIARRKARQRQELEIELEAKIKKKRQEAETARKVALQQQEDEFERRLAELRRR